MKEAHNFWYNRLPRKLKKYLKKILSTSDSESIYDLYDSIKHQLS